MSGGREQTFAEPIWVDGIGPPLQQIEQDYRELYEEEGHYANTQRQSAKDVLALIAEVKRLRAWQAARRVPDAATQQEFDPATRQPPVPDFDMCGNCGADAWEHVFWDEGDGWSCNRCFATDGGD